MATADEDEGGKAAHGRRCMLGVGLGVGSHTEVVPDLPSLETAVSPVVRAGTPLSTNHDNTHTGGLHGEHDC